MLKTPAQNTAYEDVQRAIMCLRLEVDESIANDIQQKVESAIAAAKRDGETRHCEKCFRPLTYQPEGVPCYRCDPCEQLWPAHNIALFSLSPVEAAKRDMVAKVKEMADEWDTQAYAEHERSQKEDRPQFKQLHYDGRDHLFAKKDAALQIAAALRSQRDKNQDQG